MEIYYFFLHPNLKIHTICNPDEGQQVYGKFIGQMECDAETAVAVETFMQKSVDLTREFFASMLGDFKTNKDLN